jgi:hypothetical protein
METIINYLDSFLAWVGAFWGYILDAATWVLDGFLLILQFVFFCIFDGLLIVVESFFSSLDLSAVAFSYAAQWSSLPPQTIWLVNQMALPQCVSLLFGAYAIRLILNLIPSVFTRV